MPIAGYAIRSTFSGSPNADPEVMLDQGGPLSREKNDAKLDRYAAAFGCYGFCRWVIQGHQDAEFIGYVGIMPSPPKHPLGPHVKIGLESAPRVGMVMPQRLARAAFKDAFDRAGLMEVLAYTAPDNLRSQAVMARLRLLRDLARDFTADYDGARAWR